MKCSGQVGKHETRTEKGYHNEDETDESKTRCKDNADRIDPGGVRMPDQAVRGPIRS